MKSLNAWKVGYALVICGFSMTGCADEQPAANPQQGAWQKHEYSFQYLGFTTTYSCDGLASKLRIILLAAGAREDAKAISDGCARGFGTPDRLARARLTFYTLAPGGHTQSGRA